MGLELIRKYNTLKQDNSSFLASEKVFKQVQSEYLASSAVQEDLLKHLENLVQQLSLENSVLKETFKANGLEVPIKEDPFPTLKKKQGNAKKSKADSPSVKKSPAKKKAVKKEEKPAQKGPKKPPSNLDLPDDFEWAAV